MLSVQTFKKIDTILYSYYAVLNHMFCGVLPNILKLKTVDFR